MNKLLVAALIASTALAAVATKRAVDTEYDNQQIKEDVRQLMNDIDQYGDIDTYTGSDHFERLYNWSHNINNNDRKNNN